jgi:hypothetical protein
MRDRLALALGIALCLPSLACQFRGGAVGLERERDIEKRSVVQ